MLKGKKINVRDIILDILICTLGAFIYSVGINCFISPNELSSGGATGLAILANYLWNVPIGGAMFAINIPLFVISFIVFGKNFIIKTLFSTAMTSLLIDAGVYFLPAYEGDKILAAVFGGALLGVGLGVIFTRGATSGGTDIMGRLLKKAMPHITMGRLVMICDLCVVLLAGLVYKNIESVLYATIVFIVSSKSIDLVLYGSDSGKMMMIISSNAEEIAKAITSETPRGVSIVPVKGAYTGEEKHMLLSVVRPNEVNKMRKIVRRFDEKPFIIISDASEILGLGFKPTDNEL
ncbi:MAG: YitT family protein [Clostridia bacterium]|nr:YitT family protein [Clostridia bacterium]